MMFFLHLIGAVAFIVVVTTLFALIIAATGSPSIGFLLVIGTFFVCLLTYLHIIKQ